MTALAMGTGCAPIPATPDLAGVRAATGNVSAAVNAGDSTGFVGILAGDVEVFPPGADPPRGDAARALFRELFAQSSARLEPFTNEEIQVDGDLAVQRYSFRLTLRSNAGGAATTSSGSGLHIWRRGTTGTWQLWKASWTEPAPTLTRE